MNGNDILYTPGDRVAATPSIRERLAAARAEAAKREEMRREEADAAELDRLELISRFERELGALGRAFVIVDLSDLGEGHVVLKLGEGSAWKAFTSSKMDAVDTEAFVLPCVVHPAKETYREIAMRRGFVSDRCALALSELFGVKRKDDAGK